MEKLRLYLVGLALLLAIGSAIASTTFIDQVAWYNAAPDPDLDPTLAIQDWIDSPHGTGQFPCTEYESFVLCRINARQAYADQQLYWPLGRSF
ncbi:MAG: hypothetical protein MJA30_11270 [Cytophagales bacterium]|nr:hypothetical protein [Cytophagales bacterium]